MKFDAAQHRAKPQPFFYIFALPAAELRSLCGIFRRQTNNISPRSADLGIQRQHDPDRSEEIGRFVEFGYPWSTLSEAKRAGVSYHDLRKPGWLPTSIVINILNKGEKREGRPISDEDVVSIDPTSNGPQLLLPYTSWSKEWKAKATLPSKL